MSNIAITGKWLEEVDAEKIDFKTLYGNSEIPQDINVVLHDIYKRGRKDASFNKDYLCERLHELNNDLRDYECDIESIFGCMRDYLRDIESRLKNNKEEL